MSVWVGRCFLSSAALALGLGSACAPTGTVQLELSGAGGARGGTESSGTKGSTPGSTSAGGASAATASAAAGTGTSSGEGNATPSSTTSAGGAAIASSATSAGGTTSSSSGASSSGASSSSSSSGATDPEPPDMVGMTAAHNAARASVMPAASPPLPQMAWSSTIAASAQAFTDKCVFADTGPPYGSNAFAGTGTYTPAEVVASWVSEDENYDYATNTCASGKECGHYTQVVWRDSVGLGCGMTTCTTNNPFGGSGAWQLWVCNYNPPGNYVGEMPY